MINIFISYLIITFSFGSCDWQGRPAMSDNIKESKQRKVFIREYYAKPSLLKINDSIYFDVKDAWLEKQWKYGQKSGETDIINGFQLIIETKNKIPEGFDATWTIGVDYERHIRTCGTYCLMTDFDSLPNAEKEIWKVRTGWILKPEYPKTILGDFTLYKKR